MTDYPAMFEPKERLEVSLRLPMVRLTLRPWKASSLQHGFGNKPLVEHKGRGMFAELAIRSMVEAEGWEARWVCTYGAKAKGPRYLKSWCDDSLDRQKEVPLDAEREVLLAKIAKQNHNSYSGCWDVLAWKGDRTLFIEAKHDKKDHIRATQLEWRWAALRAGLKSDDFVVAQWEFDGEVAHGGPVRARGRLYRWDEVQANNAEEYPDPTLPTYENCPEWVEGVYVTRHVSVPEVGIDYIKHTIDGFDVDPTTVVLLSLTAVVTARREAQYLIDLGDGRGMIYDADEDILYPPKSVLTLSAQPYWGDPGDLPANVQQMLDDLNAPSQSISAMADTQTDRDDASSVAFDTAFKNWFHNESDPLAVMMGMKQPDKPMPKPSTVSAAPKPKAKIDPKIARRFVWQPGDVTITNPDGTVVNP